jgi:death-on-curing protein
VTPSRWVSEEAVIAIHSALLAEHGGLPGLQSRELLESALARPRQKLAYGEPDLFDLAAAYAFGLCRDHPFADGNKRVALTVADVFLQLNGYELAASEEDAVLTFRELAAGKLAETELASWIRNGSVRLAT